MNRTNGLRWPVAELPIAAIAFVPRLVRRLRGQTRRWVEVGDLVDELPKRDPRAIDVRGADEFAGPPGIPLERSACR
jgi:hypothetical protein